MGRAAIPRVSVSVAAGKLREYTMPLSGPRRRSSATKRAAMAAACSNPPGRPPCDTATAGIRRYAPIIAAPIVPDMCETSPMFAPRLIPLTTRSKPDSGASARAAKRTAPAGVASTQCPASEVRSRISWFRLMLMLAPLCWPQGATTVTSPTARRASASAWMPGDSMPSSLVTRMRYGDLPSGAAAGASGVAPPHARAPPHVTAASVHLVACLAFIAIPRSVLCCSGNFRRIVSPGAVLGNTHASPGTPARVLRASVM